MGTIILNVVIVLGIIIAGGFLIFFLGDLLISIIDPKGEEERIKNKKKDAAKKAAEKIETLPEADKEEIKQDPQVVAILAEINETPAEEVKVEPIVEEYKVEEVADPEAEEEEAQEPTEEEKLAEARAALERRKEEILKRIQAQLDEEDDEEEEEEEEAEEEVVEEVVEETPAENEEAAAIRAELEEAKRALEAERARNAALAAELNSASTVQTVEVAGPAKTRDEYEAQIALLEARLRDNEKELKACKKEYLPLAKVNKTLANDEKKLRRKEAIVAKQKVMLYGVNNYEDIDEEKAKKLAEELDLLDGLKLSVQHCHEVMENNKDRFPVLEKMYFILKAQNEQLKADIAEAELAIKNIDEQEN